MGVENLAVSVASASCAASDDNGDNGWSCAVCTYFNRPSFLACEICGETKPDSNHLVEPIWQAQEEEDHLRLIREREEKVELEHKALISARMEEIVQMQHELWAQQEAEKVQRQASSEINLRRERLRMQEDQLREQQARVERQRRELELRMQEEQLKEEQLRIQRQREELERQEQEILAAAATATSASSNRPGAVAVPGPKAKPTGGAFSDEGSTAAYEAMALAPQRKFEKLEQEREQLQREQDVFSPCNFSTISGKQRELEQFGREREAIEQLRNKKGFCLAKRDEEKHTVSSSSVAEQYSAPRPGAVAIPGIGASAPSHVLALRELAKLEDEREELEQRQRRLRQFGQQRRLEEQQHQQNILHGGQFQGQQKFLEQKQQRRMEDDEDRKLPSASNLAEQEQRHPKKTQQENQLVLDEQKRLQYEHDREELEQKQQKLEQQQQQRHVEEERRKLREQDLCRERRRQEEGWREQLERQMEEHHSRGREDEQERQEQLREEKAFLAGQRLEEERFRKMEQQLLEQKRQQEELERQLNEQRRLLGLEQNSLEDRRLKELQETIPSAVGASGTSIKPLQEFAKSRVCPGISFSVSSVDSSLSSETREHSPAPPPQLLRLMQEQAKSREGAGKVHPKASLSSVTGEGQKAQLRALMLEQRRTQEESLNEPPHTMSTHTILAHVKSSEIVRRDGGNFQAQLPTSTLGFTNNRYQEPPVKLPVSASGASITKASMKSPQGQAWTPATHGPSASEAPGKHKNQATGQYRGSDGVQGAGMPVGYRSDRSGQYMSHAEPPTASRGMSALYAELPCSSSAAIGLYGHSEPPQIVSRAASSSCAGSPAANHRKAGNRRGSLFGRGRKQTQQDIVHVSSDEEGDTTLPRPGPTHAFEPTHADPHTGGNGWMNLGQRLTSTMQLNSSGSRFNTDSPPPQNRTVPGGRSRLMGDPSLYKRTSVADLTIAGMDQLMDGENPVWEKSSRKSKR